MFTGIVTDVGTVIEAEQRSDLRLRIRTGYDPASIDLGASICCSGVCLTVVDKGMTGSRSIFQRKRSLAPLRSFGSRVRS